MAGVPKPTALDAFRLNMADAHALVKLAEGFVNKRPRRMRVELQQRLGEALKIRAQDRRHLDCLESSDVFVTFLPGGRLRRDDFTDLSPLLRQAIVAACAATETYLADKVMEQIGPVLRNSAELPKRLAELRLTVDHWVYINKYYTVQRRGLRELVIEPAIRERSSTAPNKVGELLSMLSVTDWTKKLDDKRGVQRGDTVKTLQRITDRRNKIAHQGDRQGRIRAPHLGRRGQHRAEQPGRYRCRDRGDPSSHASLKVPICTTGQAVPSGDGHPSHSPAQRLPISTWWH